MIPGMDLVDFITWAGVLGVAICVFAETGLLVGFLLPGDSLLITAGLLTHQKVLDIDIHIFVIILFVAAFLGNNTGYLFGKHVGRKLFNRKDSPIFHKSNLEKAEVFYEKYGSRSVILACFVPFARTFVPILSGITKMSHARFMAFNTIGILLWAVGLTYLGYYAGAWLESKGVNVDAYLLPFIALIILISAAPPLFHILRNKERRQAVKETIKQTASRKKKK